MDNKEFMEIVQNANNKLYNYAYSLAKNSYDAEELLQEAIERTYERVKAEGAEPIENLEAYLIQTIKHIYYDNCKHETIKQKVRKRLEDDLEDKFEHEEIADIWVLIADKEMKSELRKALKKLKKTDKQIIVLHYAFGESLPEIAKLTGQKYDTVVYRRKRALKKLKAQLEKRNGNPFIIIILILP